MQEDCEPQDLRAGHTRNCAASDNRIRKMRGQTQAHQPGVSAIASAWRSPDLPTMAGGRALGDVPQLQESAVPRRGGDRRLSIGGLIKKCPTLCESPAVVFRTPARWGCGVGAKVNHQSFLSRVIFRAYFALAGCVLVWHRFEHQVTGGNAAFSVVSVHSTSLQPSNPTDSRSAF
jgi:hypothetical protein